LLDERIAELSARCKLDGWSSFVETLSLPQDVYPALLTGRPELLRLVQPRALSADEAGKLLKALGVLIETNMALREHAEQMAQLVDNWSGMFAGLHSTGEKIQRFANFERITAEGEEQ
jgi:hypothetical protein